MVQTNLELPKRRRKEKKIMSEKISRRGKSPCGIECRMDSEHLAILTEKEMERVEGDSPCVIAAFFQKRLKAVFYFGRDARTGWDLARQMEQAAEWMRNERRDAREAQAPSELDIWTGEIVQNRFYGSTSITTINALKTALEAWRDEMMGR
jgi:hypothetical protein